LLIGLQKKAPDFITGAFGNPIGEIVIIKSSLMMMVMLHG